MASFCSRSLQYKKLSCLQREGRAQHCMGMALLLFYTTHIITGRLGFGGKKSWTQPWKCTLYPPSLQQTGCQDLPCGPILSQGCHPLLVLRHSSTVRWEEALEMEALHGTKGWRWAWAQLSPTWAWAQLSQTWAKRSQPELKQSQAEWSGASTPMLCGIKPSIWSGVTVRCRQSHFWGFVCHCFLPQAQGQGQGVTCRKWPQSCLCPNCYMELSWCHLVCVKHLLFCTLLFLILLLLPGISYSIALCFQKIVISAHILCLWPSLIRSKEKRTGLFEV